MNIFTGKNVAVALIAGLLILANVENQASEIDSYLDNTMRLQVLEELKENMKRLYEETGMLHTAPAYNSIRAGTIGFPVADRHAADVHSYRIGVVN